MPQLFKRRKDLRGFSVVNMHMDNSIGQIHCALLSVLVRVVCEGYDILPLAHPRGRARNTGTSVMYRAKTLPKPRVGQPQALERL